MLNPLAEIERSRAEAKALGQVSIVEITPSRRDFGLYVATQKESLAVIARLDPAPDSLAQASDLDDAEVAALALSLGDIEVGIVRAISQKVSAPLWRLDYIVAANQIYASRLHGFDAILLPATALDAQALAELTAVAASLHMSTIVEVSHEREVQAAAGMAHVSLAIRIDDNDLDRSRRLTAGIDRSRAVIGLSQPDTLEQTKALQGIFDAVVVGAERARQLL